MLFENTNPGMYNLHEHIWELGKKRIHTRVGLMCEVRSPCNWRDMYMYKQSSTDP